MTKATIQLINFINENFNEHDDLFNGDISYITKQESGEFHINLFLNNDTTKSVADDFKNIDINISENEKDLYEINVIIEKLKKLCDNAKIKYTINKF